MQKLHQIWFAKHAPVTVAFILTFLTSLLIALQAFNPVILADEFTYAIASHHWGNPSAGETWTSMPNQLYFALYHVVHRLGGTNFYAYTKVLNSLWIALAVFPAYEIARKYVDRTLAIGFAAYFLCRLLMSLRRISCPKHCITLDFGFFAG